MRLKEKESSPLDQIAKPPQKYVFIYSRFHFSELSRLIRLEGSLKRILIIEDDPDILELLQYNLERHNFAVQLSTDGELGLEDIRNNVFDLVILDIMLPGMSGLDVLKKIRFELQPRPYLPIMLLSAKSQETDVVLGLELGADDYLTKPFSIRELVARIRSLFRRQDVRDDIPHSDTISVRELTLDTGRHQVYFGEREVKLTSAEFRLLRALARKPGFVLSREELLQEVAGENVAVTDRSIDVHIRAIRRKIPEGADLIETVRGIGYKCQEPRSHVN